MKSAVASKKQQVRIGNISRTNHMANGTLTFFFCARAQALDAVQRTRSKEPFDPFTSGNHGLLEEMSLAELKERVGRLREQERAWEEEQRAKIAAQKQEKESALLSKAETISKARERAEALRKAKRAARAVEARAKEEEGERARQEGEVKLAERLQVRIMDTEWCKSCSMYVIIRQTAVKMPVIFAHSTLSDLGLWVLAWTKCDGLVNERSLEMAAEGVMNIF